MIADPYKQKKEEIWLGPMTKAPTPARVAFQWYQLNLVGALIYSGAERIALLLYTFKLEIKYHF